MKLPRPLTRCNPPPAPSPSVVCTLFLISHLTTMGWIIFNFKIARQWPIWGKGGKYTHGMPGPCRLTRWSCDFFNHWKAPIINKYKGFGEEDYSIWNLKELQHFHYRLSTAVMNESFRHFVFSAKRKRNASVMQCGAFICMCTKFTIQGINRYFIPSPAVSLMHTMRNVGIL